jgi:UDP-2,3-diacylglucosamine pyrophosphatase LpxH
MSEEKKYRSVFISDVHLGFKNADPTYLLEFMKTFECETLYLVGDIIDGWALEGSKYWPQKHNDVIQKILKKARKGTSVYYIPGNHDEFIRQFGEMHFGNIAVLDQIIHKTVDGKKLLVIHGDQFDIVMRHAKWLAHIGSYAYDVSISCNALVNKIRHMLGMEYWSLSNWLKYRVKSAVNFVGEFENTLSDYAKSKGADGVVCGHIHYASVKKIDGIDYYNCGDWVESHTALVEHYDGKIELIKWNNT